MSMKDGPDDSENLIALDSRMLARSFGRFRVAIETLAVVAALILVRALLWAVGVEGMTPTALPRARSPEGSSS
jgi:hypothetical protein